METDINKCERIYTRKDSQMLQLKRKRNTIIIFKNYL